MQIDLGSRIRQLRLRDGKTQETLARALGVTAQAVSRWEAGGSYPDMNLIPPIANYFGVTIDELFGYTNERDGIINSLVDRLQQRKWKQDTQANVALARNALVEFPGNEKLMVCLASALYADGYTRLGEYHLTDGDGFDVYDTERHKGYPQWQEAVALYEKALQTLEDGELRRVAVGELIQLHANMGQYEKSRALAEAAPGIYSTKEYMRICSCDGKDRVRAYGEAILAMVHASSALMVQAVMASGKNMTVPEKIQSLRGAIDLFHGVCPDGNYGEHHRLAARICTLLSVYLWADDRREEAFTALDEALDHFRRFEALCQQEDPGYTAPLVRLVKLDFSRCARPDPEKPETTAVSLYEAWPWWHVPEEEQVRREMQQDPRWMKWIQKCQM